MIVAIGNVVKLVTRKRIGEEIKDHNLRVVIRLVRVTNSVIIYIFIVLQYILIDKLKKSMMSIKIIGNL